MDETTEIEVTMSDREAIFKDIRDALAPLADNRTPYPEWGDGLVVTENHPAGLDKRVDRFKYRLEAVHGTFVSGLAALRDWLRSEGLTRGYIDPALKELFADDLGGFELETEIDRSRIDEYAFGITRASGAIAETGTIILTDRKTSSRLGALAPWVHVAVIKEEEIYPDVPSAVAAFDDDPSIIFVTGPSKTADVEGILIEGVHGPGKQLACLI